MAYSDKVIDHYENPPMSARLKKATNPSVPAWSAHRPAAM